jgi:hypothetical protein
MDGMLLALDQMGGKLSLGRHHGPDPDSCLAIEALDCPMSLRQQAGKIDEDRAFPGRLGHSNHSAISARYEYCVT